MAGRSDDASLRRIAAGALAIWLFTAGVQAWRHDLAHLAWGCYLALLWIAAGCLRRSALANAIGTLWLCAGFPLWVIDLAQGDIATVVSTATHLGGLCLGLAAAARLGVPRGTWWKALGLTILVQRLTLGLLPAAGDVNMAFAVWPGWERLFPSYLPFWAALMGYCGVVFLVAESWLSRRWPAQGEPAPRLVLPALVHEGNRGGAVALAYAGFLLTLELYWRWTFRAPLALPLTPLDRAIPFWPPSIALYLACFPYVAVGLFALRERDNLNRVYASLVLAWLAAVACFVIQPTLVGARDPSGLPPLTRGLFRLLDRVDDLRVHGNSFPSMHVGFALLVAWGYRAEQRRWYPWMLAFAVLIGASTLLAKRHYVIDAAGGVAVAWLARRVVDAFVEFRQLPAGSTAIDWAPRILYRYPPQTMERVTAETAKLAR